MNNSASSNSSSSSSSNSLAQGGAGGPSGPAVVDSLAASIKCMSMASPPVSGGASASAFVDPRPHVYPGAPFLLGFYLGIKGDPSPESKYTNEQVYGCVTPGGIFVWRVQIVQDGPKASEPAKAAKAQNQEDIKAGRPISHPAVKELVDFETLDLSKFAGNSGVCMIRSSTLQTPDVGDMRIIRMIQRAYAAIIADPGCLGDWVARFEKLVADNSTAFDTLVDNLEPSPETRAELATLRAKLGSQREEALAKWRAAKDAKECPCKRYPTGCLMLESCKCCWTYWMKWTTLLQNVTDKAFKSKASKQLANVVWTGVSDE